MVNIFSILNIDNHKKYFHWFWDKERFKLICLLSSDAGLREL